MMFLAANLQGEDARSGAGHGHAAAGLIAKAAAAVIVTALDVLDGAVDSIGRHVAAEIARGAQGHHLPAGYADVSAIAGQGAIAPATAMMAGRPLRLEDDAHSLG